MSSQAGPTTNTGGGGTSLAGLDRHRDTTTAKHSLPMPGLSGSANGPVGNLLKGPVDDSGKLKDAALLVGIKLDLEAEVHATARVRDEMSLGNVRMGYKIVSKGIAAHSLTGFRYTSIAVVEIVLHVWVVGFEDLLVATTSSLVFTLI
ncbi:hypothetical protein Hte_010554 [Hypoxylon texense]